MCILHVLCMILREPHETMILKIFQGSVGREEGAGKRGRGDKIFTLHWYNSGIQHKMTLTR